MDMEPRPDLQFDDQALPEPWPMELDYGDAAEEEFEEEPSSASFGSLANMRMGKPKKRPVLEVDPEELAKANRQFELSSATILENPEERPALAYGKIGLDPVDGTEPDFDAEDEKAIAEELAAGTIEPDAEELRPETAARLNAMLGLGAESVTAEYDVEAEAALPSLTGTSAKTGKKPLFVHTDDGEAGGAADEGIAPFEAEPFEAEPFEAEPFEEAAQLPEWEEPTGGAVPGSFDQVHEPPAEFEEPFHGELQHEEPASPAGVWDPPEEDFAEPQWPDEPAWPDLYPDEEESLAEGVVQPAEEPVETFGPETSAPEVVEAEAPAPPERSSVVLSVEEFEEETHDFMSPAAQADRQVLARMERPASHSSVRARLVRDTAPSKSLWQHCWTASVSLWRLLTGRR